jgi:serine/threonine protein kinase
MSELKLQQSRLDGRYDVLECLGRGSYAEIYVAKDNAAAEGAPTTVVIKALNIFLQETPDAELEHTLVSNFQNEAVALDLVRHPHIISRLGHGTAIDLGGTTFHYIVLEYMPGGDMAALSRHHPLSIEKAIAYLEQVCSGLAHAHRCGVIHRDIKPQNLLLTSDRKTVKIADFGVARLDSMEGAITRVGTNIYAAPEHNPLVQTGPLESGSLRVEPALTAAADIYSLAKTVYSLIAGEAPRRFAHKPIAELPEEIRQHYWSEPVLHVLEKATQTRPEFRHQTVAEFWDELADAVLPPTQPLSEAEALKRRPSSDWMLEAEEITQAPPRPRFEEVLPEPAYVGNEVVTTAKRPKIVVPVSMLPAAAAPATRPSAKDIVRAFPDQPRRNGRANLPSRPAKPSSRTKRFIVALVLIVCFSGMLLATHKYVTSNWNPLLRIPQLESAFIVGREGVTTTDVNLRGDPSSTNTAIGLAEFGSRVKVLAVNNNWYEVQVTQHGRPKTDPFASDRGWLNKKFVKLD